MRNMQSHIHILIFFMNDVICVYIIVKINTKPKILKMYIDCISMNFWFSVYILILGFVPKKEKQTCLSKLLH